MELWKGRVGSEVYSVHNGRQVIKNYSPKVQVPTIRQQVAQDKFNRAVWYWKNFYRNIMPLNKFIQQYFRSPQRYPDTRFIYDLASLTAGDLCFFDKAARKYCAVKQQQLAQIIEDYDEQRYATNWDTFVGYQNNVAHFVARDDAAPSQSIYNNNNAATACYYRLEIEVGMEGNITFSADSGNAQINNTTITWEPNNTLDEIFDKFKALNTTQITFAKLKDNKGVGLEIGGNGANTLTVEGTPVHCKVIDCSGLAFLRSQNTNAPQVGETLNPDAEITYLGFGVHHNFRGVSARSILGTSLVNASTDCKANDGYDYSYRTGINYAKFKAWATTSGDDTYYDDGEGGTDQSQGHVMKKSRFDTEVTNYTGSDSHRLGMKTYYDHLLNDQTGDYATLRQKYESWYNSQMTSMYDAYLMSHMIGINTNSGITAIMRNKGLMQTRAKADCMNITYNYIIIPAYPPEYNAQQYGKSASEGFAPGMYYHPEPADIGLMFRDDIMPLINVNITASGGGTQLNNSLSRGLSADFNANYSWFFFGSFGCLYAYYARYSTDFRCRPCLAIEVPSLAQLRQQSRSIEIEPEENIEPTPEETPIEDPEQDMR